MPKSEFGSFLSHMLILCSLSQNGHLHPNQRSCFHPGYLPLPTSSFASYLISHQTLITLNILCLFTDHQFSLDFNKFLDLFPICSVHNLYQSTLHLRVKMIFLTCKHDHVDPQRVIGLIPFLTSL